MSDRRDDAPPPATLRALDERERAPSSPPSDLGLDSASQRFRALDARKREAVLAAASGAFARHGYRAASTNEIAQRARVSKGALFSYFPTKEDLFSAVLARLFDELEREAERVRSVAERDGLFAALRARALGAVALQRRAPELAAIAAQLERRGDELPAGRAAAQRARYAAVNELLLRELLERAQRRGELREGVPPRAALRLVDAALRGFCEGALEARGGEAGPEAALDELLALLARALRPA